MSVRLYKNGKAKEIVYECGDSSTGSYRFIITDKLVSKDHWVNGQRVSHVEQPSTPACLQYVFEACKDPEYTPQAPWARIDIEADNGYGPNPATEGNDRAVYKAFLAILGGQPQVCHTVSSGPPYPPRR